MSCPTTTPDVVVVATPVPPWFVKRPPFEFGDWSGVDYPCVGVNGDVCSLGTSSIVPYTVLWFTHIKGD